VNEQVSRTEYELKGNIKISEYFNKMKITESTCVCVLMVVAVLVAAKVVN